MEVGPLPSDQTADELLREYKVTMLVWNGFVYDARVTREAETLIARGLDVEVICVLTDQRPVVDEVLDSGLKVHRVSRKNRWLTRILLLPRGAFLWLIGRISRSSAASVRSRLSRPSRWWELDRKLAMALELLAGNLRMVRSAVSRKAEFLHANDVNTLVPGFIAAKLTGARLIYDAHEISADREGYRGRVWSIRVLEKYLGRQAAGRISTTQSRADWFLENYNYPDMGVVQNRPVYVNATGNRIRDTFRIPADKLVVLYQGGLQSGRGLHNLVSAVRQVPGVHLVFVGDGRQRESLIQSAYDMDDRVHFAGQIPLADLPSWTASADIGMQTLRNTCLNHYTTDSNKLFEYVMAGLPVIASDFPEIRTIVNESELGILIDPDDIEDIAAAIRRLEHDDELRKRFRQNALRARERLDWRSQEPAFLSVYTKALLDE